jgi:hypothetical protein
MPPRARKTTGADQAPDAADSGLCPQHYPLGWETVPEEHNGVGCEHGSWTREPAEPVE